MTRRIRRTTASISVATALLLGISACGGGSTQSGDDESTGQGNSGNASPEAATSETPSPPIDEILADVETNEKLHQQLPEDIKKSGELQSVMSGAFPPYTIPAKGKNDFVGASIDMRDALAKVLGVKITTNPVEGLSGVLSGMASGRYDFAMGPVGDYEERRDKAVFIDWVQEYVAFLTPEGNPNKIGSIEDTCGLSVAVQAGGSAERVIREQSKECEEKGEDTINVQSFPDQPSSVLAVRSGRADTFFSSQAPLTYFASQATGQLSVAAKGKPNDFDPILQGAVFPMDSELEPIVVDAFQVLFENGTYDEIMKKWGLEDQMLEEPTVNRKPIDQ